MALSKVSSSAMISSSDRSSGILISVCRLLIRSGRPRNVEMVLSCKYAAQKSRLLVSLSHLGMFVALDSLCSPRA
jgi:hypothetical protein